MPHLSAFRLHLSGQELSQVYELKSARTSIGRQPGNDLQLENSLVSRHHALIELVRGKVQITDLGSSNGTRLNGERLSPNVAVKLNDGDIFEIGPYQFRLEKHVVLEQSIAKKEKTQRQPHAVVGPSEALPEQSPHLDGVPLMEDPPAGAPPPPKPAADLRRPEQSPIVPTGLSIYSQRLLNYLPGIYHTDFMSRFLGLFESILLPIEWTIDNFDLYLAASTSPSGFLPWLANWFEISFDSSWDERQCRDYLKDAYTIYSRHGTRWAMSRVLEIFTGCKPEIVDTGEDLQPFEFLVRLPVDEHKVNRRAVEALIEAHKPAHTHCLLEFIPGDAA